MKGGEEMERPDYISRIVFDGNLPSESYLTRLPVIRHLTQNKELSFSSPVTFFVGENGTGKSTLLEAIAVAYGFNPEGGSRNFSFATNQTHSELHEHLQIVKRGFPKDGYFLRAESLYNVATNIDELDGQPAASPPLIEGYGGVSLHRQSHGESFLSIVQNRFFGQGLYILDEPEAALSPMRLLTLLTHIDRLVKNGSQLIIATHSPILMAYPDGEILSFTQGGIEKTSYEQTEHYRVTKQFLDHPQKMLHYLFNGE